MDETIKPLRIPPQMSVYADKHKVFHLLQVFPVSLLVIDQPKDPISYLINLLQRNSADIPRIIVLGPPAVGKHTVVSNIMETICVFSILFRTGWVLEGIPQTQLQALSLQQVGIIPEHVVMLEAPDDVLLERRQGKLVDPITGDVYHKTFIWPSQSERQRLAELQRYRCEVTGLTSAYQHVLKIINSDQPHTDVYQQVLAFVRTRRCPRTPRILLLGPPGSGKKHQARLLSEKYRMVDGTLTHTDTHNLDVPRSIVIVPDSLVLQVLEERLGRVDCSCRGWILHGFPSDLQQAKSLQESQHQPNRVFLLDLTDDVCLERITLRATDPVSGETFHSLVRPAPSSEVQDRLKTRPEDSTNTATHTLRQYRMNIATLFPDVVYIDADQDPHSVFGALENSRPEE
uniref:Adenylate kinase 8 n=1 Tax=Labrus bergylta TaxID=56723 RepID=A0A3Q3EU39_9LABR